MENQKRQDNNMSEVVRNVDELGRIVLPIGMRKQLGICDGQVGLVSISIRDDEITVKKYIGSCTLCKNEEELISWKGNVVCRSCFEKRCPEKTQAFEKA